MSPKDYPIWKWKEPGQVLKGTYTNAIHGVGRYHKSVRIIKEDHPKGRGKSWKLFDVSEIRDALMETPFGAKIRIEFIGKVQTKNSKKNHAFHFKININRSGKPLTPEQLTPAKKTRTVAAHQLPRRQSLATPPRTVGRQQADGAAAKKRNQVLEKVFASPPVPLQAVTVPPPKPPEDYQNDFKRRLAAKLKGV